MAKLNTGTTIYGTANVYTSVYIGQSNTTTGTGGILATSTTLLIGNASQSTTIDNGGVVAPNLIASNYIQRSGSFYADATSVVLYQPLYVNGTGSLSAGSTGYILSSNGTSSAPYWRDYNRKSSTASASTVTLNALSFDTYIFTALSTALTFNASTSANNGDKIIIRIADDGTARALTWTGVSENPRTTAGAFRQIGLTLPTTTVIGKTLYIGLVYNSDIVATYHPVATWDAIAYTIEA